MYLWIVIAIVLCLVTSILWGLRGAMICFAIVPAFALYGGVTEGMKLSAVGRPVSDALSAGLLSFSSGFFYGLILWLFAFPAGAIGVVIWRRMKARNPGLSGDKETNSD